MTLTELLAPEFKPETGCNHPKQPGDLVMVGMNHGPVFEVIYVANGLAWIKPVKNGQEGLVPLDRLRLAPSPL